ncbi:hypothetical protein [Allofustis seminis]|uniref:hypothetical protein n=1 Tax=Allofustis seminis TaxID=166939 RepID=UPI00035D8FC9|nr:hypothetical protein [Allofustis seminis]
MKYEVKIGEIHLYKDLGLVITSKPIINLPSPRFSYIEIPGVQGAIELEDKEEVLYATREGSLEFMISDIEKFEPAYQNLLNEVHGQKRTLMVDDKYFYYGRFQVDGLSTDKNYSFIKISYVLDPYKYFQEDIERLGVRIIQSVKSRTAARIHLNEEMNMLIKPSFTVRESSNLRVLFNEKEYKLYDGENIIPQIKGKNKVTLSFKGRGEIEISYKRGDL